MAWRKEIKFPEEGRVGDVTSRKRDYPWHKSALHRVMQ